MKKEKKVKEMKVETISERANNKRIQTARDKGIFFSHYLKLAKGICSVIYIGLWGLEEPVVSGLDRRSLLVFVALLRAMWSTPICFSAGLARAVATRRRHWSNTVASEFTQA